MDTLKGNCAQLSTRLEAQKQLLTDAESRNKAAARQMEQLRGYAAVFENATASDRRLIASALIECVRVHPGYRLEIQFRIGLDCLEGISVNEKS